MFCNKTTTQRKCKKQHVLGTYRVGPGYLLIVQGVYWIQMLKYRNVRRNASNFRIISAQKISPKGGEFLLWKR